MKPNLVEYRFHLPGGVRHSIVMGLDPATLEARAGGSGALPDWTRLEFHKCPNCPLTPAQSPRCPAAAGLVELTRMGAELLSHDALEVEVVTPERTVSGRTTAQRAVSSLMGLAIATSGCPHTRFFKTMAHFHLPFATEEETIFRAVSVYLLGQYFRRRAGETPDWELEGLNRIYRDVQTINTQLAHRLRAASSKDAAVNAVILLDLLAKAVPDSIADSLEEIRRLFPFFIAGPGAARPP